jgi:hypothetical protein
MPTNSDANDGAKRGERSAGNHECREVGLTEAIRFMVKETSADEERGDYAPSSEIRSLANLMHHP